MSNETMPSVIRFEQAVKNKEYETACQELLRILNKLDSNFGGVQGIECDFPQALENMGKEQYIHFCTRVAVATTALFTDPNLQLQFIGAKRFFVVQRWLAIIFASSPYINADHILRTYNQNPDGNVDELRIEPTESALVKFCILYFPESNVNLNLDALWEFSPILTASLCFALQSPRFIATQPAFSKRGAILQWFPEKLALLKNLNDLPSGITHDVYMHCSYDVIDNKHLVKKSLNKVIRHYLLENGWRDLDTNRIGYRNGKPVMVVLLEHFHSGHSIYRTHSTSINAAREHFYIIGIGNSSVDEIGKEVFDEFHVLNDSTVMDRLEKIKLICDETRPAVFYMPSIGMDLATIFVSNTRLAPIQAVALGHPATTHSDFIEYVIVEDDYVGSEDCFSEKLIRLPKDALPYVPSSAAPISVEYRLRENPEIVQIGVASATMKLNPYFLEACRVIRDRSQVKVHFNFALGQSTGITHPYVERFIKSYLGDDATIYPHLPYEQYLQVLHQCDMMINPFPFGNTNGIIDMVTLGLVGVCKTGPEVHEHIDEGLFKRLGLPDWLIANTVDEYVERAIRLAENHKERLEIRRYIIDNNGLQTLFTGDPSPMGKILLEKAAGWAKQNNVEFNITEVAKPKVKKAIKPKSEVKITVKKSAKKAETKADEKEMPKKRVAKKPAEKKASPLKKAVKELAKK